jgi:hypothetical protein
VCQAVTIYWGELVKMVLYWGLFRRPTREHAAILEAVRGSMSNVDLMREVETMANQIDLTREQELLIRGREQGQVLALRGVLRKALQKRFPHVPEAVLQRIDSADLPWLQTAVARLFSMKSLEELPA